MLDGVIAGRLTAWVGSARIIWLSILVLGLPQFLIPLATPGWGVVFYVVGLFSFMVTAVVYNTAQVSYRHPVTPPNLLGRMNASVRFLVSGMMPLGAVIGGVLGSWIGGREPLWVAVAGSWCAGLFMYLSPLRTCREVDDLDHEEPAAAPLARRPDPTVS